MNPYGQVGFFDFFKVAFLRLYLVFTGKWDLLVTDELQFLTLSCVGIACCLVGTFLIFQKVRPESWLGRARWRLPRRPPVSGSTGI